MVAKSALSGQTPISEPVEPVDWSFAKQAARRVVKNDPFATSYLSDSLTPDFSEAIGLAREYIAEHVGFTLKGKPIARVVDRFTWIDANIDLTRKLSAPLTDRIGEKLSQSSFAPVGRRFSGMELGLMLGWVSRRVLGQYGLILPERADDTVFFVGPNVLALEKRYAFRPRDFRLWITAHEVTHWGQFTGVPWLREHVLELSKSILELIDPDPQKLQRVLKNAASSLRNDEKQSSETGIFGLLATPEQRKIIEQLQAVMSVLEGHGNYVMNQVGKSHIVGGERMERILHTRRQAAGASAVMQKLIGLDVKMRQYLRGEAFITNIASRAGHEALSALWESPSNMPTLVEISHPTNWLKRLGLRSESD